MSANKMFSLLDDLLENIPDKFYKNLRNKMTCKVYEKSQTILDCGDSIKYLYYLEKGFARGLDEQGNMIWFCEENEIILFNKFSSVKSRSAYQVIVEKKTIIYRISIQDIFEFADEKFVENLLSACVDASQCFYFCRLFYEN